MEDGPHPIGWGPFYAAPMTPRDVTVRIQGHRAGILTVTRSGAVTRDNGDVDERDVTVTIRCLAQDGRADLAGRVQGWWWTQPGCSVFGDDRTQNTPAH